MAAIAGLVFLFGRARDRTVGTEHAAVSGLGLQHRAATRAAIKELAGVGRHGLRPGRGAMRARKNRLQDHRSKPYCQIGEPIRRGVDKKSLKFLVESGEN